MSTFEERRRARANWPVRRVKLEDEEITDLRETTTVDERLAMVWALTMQQWAFAQRPLPSYRREDMPGRIFRGVVR